MHHDLRQVHVDLPLYTPAVSLSVYRKCPRWITQFPAISPAFARSARARADIQKRDTCSVFILLTDCTVTKTTATIKRQRSNEPKKRERTPKRVARTCRSRDCVVSRFNCALDFACQGSKSSRKATSERTMTQDEQTVTINLPHGASPCTSISYKFERSRGEKHSAKYYSQLSRPN